MTAAVRLVCPLCGAIAWEGGEPEPGACPACGAAFAGGEGDPPSTVAAAARTWGAGADPRAIASGLFALLPDDPLSRRVAVTSDHRAGFYRWWVFLAAGEDAGAVLGEVAARAGAPPPG